MRSETEEQERFQNWQENGSGEITLKFKPDEDGWKDMQEFISKHKSKQSIL